MSSTYVGMGMELVTYKYVAKKLRLVAKLQIVKYGDTSRDLQETKPSSSLSFFQKFSSFLLSFGENKRKKREEEREIRKRKGSLNAGSAFSDPSLHCPHTILRGHHPWHLDMHLLQGTIFL